MPRKDPPMHTRFKPGVSGNPGGRPALPPELLEARKFTRNQVELTLSKWLSKSNDELIRASNDESVSALDRVVVSIILNAVKHGDHTRLDFLLNRIIGKVKDEIDMTLTPKPTVIEKRDGGEVILGTKEKEER